MNNQRDLELILNSRHPVVLIETPEEKRMLDLLRKTSISRASDAYLPLFRWTVTDGLQRLDIDLEPQLHNAEPPDVLRHIRAVSKPGVYVLLDFHPFLEDPVNVRLIKDVALRYHELPKKLVFLSHAIKLPVELEPFAARIEADLPDDGERKRIVNGVANRYRQENHGTAVKTDAKAFAMLIGNLAGLTFADTERLAENAIFDDGVISHCDIASVMQAKYELLNRGGILQFEYETADFDQVGGLTKLKNWLRLRKAAFSGHESSQHLDIPKGVLLIGVQGCGKSLAAKATAGIFGLPLLRLDFATLYNKYHGETERNLRESLKTADVMAPCVLWIDEIEKGLAGRGGETGTAQRVLGTFLNWLAEKDSRVFVVATANDINGLPPELIRKGRFDELFFVDLPTKDVREQILDIHLRQRGVEANDINAGVVADACEGFSGAEIEQVIVAAMYSAHAKGRTLTETDITDEIERTRPLSVVMSEKMNALRLWASERTVACD